jgi:hypothetical protein
MKLTGLKLAGKTIKVESVTVGRSKKPSPIGSPEIETLRLTKVGLKPTIFATIYFLPFSF